MDNILHQLQSDVDKITNQRNKNLYSRNSNRVDEINQHDSLRDYAMSQLSNQSVVFTSPKPQPFKMTNTSQDPLRYLVATARSRDESPGITSRQLTHSQPISGSHSPSKYPSRSQVEQYNHVKDQVKDVFLSKDELFRIVNSKFKKILKSQTEYIKGIEGAQTKLNDDVEMKGKYLLELVDELRLAIKTQEQIFQQEEQNVDSKEVIRIVQDKNQDRKILKSKVSKVGRKYVSTQRDDLSQHASNQSLDGQELSDSDCNVDEEEEAIKAMASERSNQIRQEQRRKETRQQLAQQNFNTIDQLLEQLCQGLQEQNDISQFFEEAQAREEAMLQDYASLYEQVREMEDRYYSTTIAWEKEMRELINKNKAKSERLITLEAQVKEINLSKSESKLRYDQLIGEISLINKQLYALYGPTYSSTISPAGYSTQIGRGLLGLSLQSEDQAKIEIEAIKRIIEDNQRLKNDFEKLLENVESSRSDYQKIHATNKAAVQGIPTLLAQQLKQTKESYEAQIMQVQSQYDQRMKDLSEELQKSRTRVIELIDEKSKLEKELFSLKLERKELKAEVNLKVKKIQDLELQVSEHKYKSSHIVMQAESKSIAINEVSSRNDLLSESLDKTKAEIQTLKKLLTQLENEKFEKEKETIRLRKESKTFDDEKRAWWEEKEHLIQMIEMKNHLIASSNGDQSFDKQVDFFQAIQKLSMFVLNKSRGSVNGSPVKRGEELDENTKNIVRNIFNENVCQLLDQYEAKIEQQRKQIIDLNKELADIYQVYHSQCESHINTLEILSDFETHLNNTNKGEMPTQLMNISERFEELSEQIQTDLKNTRKEAENKAEKIKLIHVRLESLKNDMYLGSNKNQVRGQNSSFNLSSPSKKSQQEQEQLIQQIEQLRLVNENLKYKVDELIADQEELQRQVQQGKKKDQDIAKLKQELDKVKRQGVVTEPQRQQDPRVENDLKEVIRRLDSELKREKSQVSLLKQKLGNDGSLFEALDFFGGDDSFFDKQNEMLQTLNQQKEVRDKSRGRRNKKSSENTSQTPSSSANPKTNTKAQLRKEILDLKKQVEDGKQMIELQCIVVEDLLKQRASIQSQVQSPAPVEKLNMSKYLSGNTSSVSEAKEYPNKSASPSKFGNSNDSKRIQSSIQKGSIQPTSEQKLPVPRKEFTLELQEAGSPDFNVQKIDEKRSPQIVKAKTGIPRITRRTQSTMQ